MSITSKPQSRWTTQSNYDACFCGHWVATAMFALNIPQRTLYDDCGKPRVEDISIFIDICCTWCASRTVCTIVWTVIQSKMLIRKFITNHITIPRQAWNYLVRDNVMMYVANLCVWSKSTPNSIFLKKKEFTFQRHWLKQRLLEWMA